MADYTVQAGDNLSRIAQAHGTTVEALCQANGIKDPDKIQIGQILSIGNSEEAEPPKATAEDVEAKLAAQEARIAELEKQGVGDLIERDLNDLYEWGEEKVDQGKEWAKEKYQKGKEAVEDAYETATEYVEEKVDQGKEWAKEKYQKGKEAVENAYEATTEYVEKKVEQGKEAVKKGAHAVDEAFDNAVSNANERMQKRYIRAQEADDKFTEAVKFDMPEEEAPVDTSQMTPEERAEYNEQRIAELEQRTVAGMVKEGIKEKVDKGKETHNKIVDKQHDFRETVRGTVADWIDKGADALKGLFDW